MAEADPIDEALAGECHVFCHYLLGVPPDDAVVAHYLACHAVRPGPLRRGDRFDRILVGLARLGRLPCALADAYASRFRRHGPLRCKLVLLLGLLECRPRPAAVIDRPDTGGPALVVSKLVLAGAAYGACVLIGVIGLGPLHLVCRLTGSTAAGEAS